MIYDNLSVAFWYFGESAYSTYSVFCPFFVEQFFIGNLYQHVEKPEVLDDNFFIEI